MPADWNWVLRHLLELVLQVPRANQEFHVLQYTFLSQIGHREDFRKRLARLYEEWRGALAEYLVDSVPTKEAAPKTSPRTRASLVEALLHGIAVQLAADTNAFDRQEMLNLCTHILGTDQSSQTANANGRAPRRKSASRASTSNGSIDQ
jgi:hypothetical protein